MRKKLTTEDFIRRAKEIHGDKYDYSKVKYEYAITKVCIICPKHGEFWQRPYGHLNGQGCSKCSGTKRSTTEEFINKARKVHGDKYDYSNVEYIGNKTKVCIICPEHGEFWQTPNSHLKGIGCPDCAKTTRGGFIKKAREVHGDKYDYSKVEYKGINTKVCIICPKHGEFWQRPSSHLYGCGCRECAYKLKFTKEDFIRKAKEVHGDKYDYSKAEYKGAKVKVCIICPEHGEFWQDPNSHLSGKGCPKCVGRNKTIEEFIEQARKVHGDKYDYSKVEYKGINTKVCIICPEHGEFWQSPYNHLNGHGCPNCYSLRKRYKFNLLKEFESEYSFRAFLANSDINILRVILRNIESKYEPLKKDIEIALSKASIENPIKALEEKYSSTSDEETDEELLAEKPIESISDIDLDDDDAIDALEENNVTNQSIDEMVGNFEKEIKVINKIEHMLTPEDRRYIMDKFLNDKRRIWMFKREESVK